MRFVGKNLVFVFHWMLNSLTGIIGYGHIGTQLGILAESMGMQVLFYDIENIMAMGNSRWVAFLLNNTDRCCENLEALLTEADFVTCHVPSTKLTKNMIGEKELSMMKKGSYLLNASRGSVVRCNQTNWILGGDSCTKKSLGKRTFGRSSSGCVSPGTAREY